MSKNAARLIGFLFLSQALFLVSTFRTTTTVLLVTSVFAAIVYARRRSGGSQSGRNQRTGQRTGRASLVRRFFYGLGVFLTFVLIVGITAVWRIEDQAGESINFVYVGSDVLAHAALFSSMAVWALRPQRGHVSMLPLGLIVVLLCVAAGGASLSFAGQTTVALAACVGFTLASQIILGVARGTDGTVLVSDRSAEGKPGWMGPAFSLLTLSILMMATSVIANGTTLVLPGLQERLQRQLEASFDPIQEDMTLGGTRYVRGSVLGMIRRHILADPQAIALRIHSKVAPGYLRGSAFDLYRRGQWMLAGGSRFRQLNRIQSIRVRSVEPSMPGSVQLEHSTAQLQRFPLADTPAENTLALEIYNDPMKGQVVFMPLTTHWIEARSRELTVTNHGIVALGVDVSNPYVAGVGLTGIREELDFERRQVLLNVPSSVASETNRLAQQICASQPTPRGKALAVSKYFQGGFGYNLSPAQAPKGVDPLAHFLTTGHDAHCEYFASATTLLLRSAGVPTRYVTGYVADEYNDESALWISRHRDAHAWAEAYDDIGKQWFAVESTPGRIYHTVDANANTLADANAFDALGDDLDDENISMISRAIGWILSMRATDPLLLLFRLAQLPLFCVLVFVVWTKYIRGSGPDVDLADVQSRKMLRKVDRRVRKYALVRRPSETLYQFADRIDSRGADPQGSLREETIAMLADVSDWYRQYASARYQGRLPSPLA